MSAEEPFDIEQRWPDVFEPLTAEQRRNVVQTLAISWHEGWDPNREDTALLADYVSGAISAEEYARRSDEIVERRHG